MSEPRRLRPRQGGAGRGTSITIGIFVVIIALVVLGRLGGIYVDWLWFQSVAMEQVFVTRLVAQLLLFAVSGIAFFAVFWANIAIAMRLAQRRDVFGNLVLGQRPPRVSPLLKYGFLAAGLLLALLSALSTGSSWELVLRYLNPSAFGVSDPLFGRDVGFFVFTLPVLNLIQGWFMATILLSALGAAALYFVQTVLPQIQLSESAEGQPPTFRLDLTLGQGVKAHLSVLLALFVFGFAFRYWLDIFGLVYSSPRLVYGAGFADVNARLPALWLMVAVAVVFAVLILLSIRRRGYALLVAGVVGWLGIWIVAGGIYPALVQRFQVLPSELDKESPYLSYNIEATNRAYLLDGISEVEYPASDAVTAAEIADNPGTIKNIRLLDPAPLLDTYNQIQSIRLYYDFLDVDVDRYMIDNEYRQVMLSAREISPERLPAQAQTWVNRTLQYTHGYGAAMSPVNEVTPEGLPQLFMRDVPPQGKLPLTRPEIYYGESANDFVIVKTSTSEFDYPKGNDNVYVEYQGNSGVKVGDFFRQALFAWQFGDLNILLAGAIKADSSVLFYRNIIERAQRIAPFLRYDRDPYLVLAGGRLYWVIDAYTATDRYPYSQPINLRGQTVNYLRNSVKVVIDAYEGNVQFYLADETDPLVASYAKIFPTLFVPLAQMPAELRSHVRYPEDLFQAQAQLYRTYHMRDPRVFYNKEDLWNVPSQIRGEQTTPIEPYYVIMRLPGEQREEFILILPFTPPNKDNMITWLAARSDGEAYGKLVAYRYPKDKLIYGPMQIEARINQEPIISQQLTLWDQAGSRVIRGNLIVIPIGQSNLYVEPIYLQSQQTKLPEMKRVVLATGNRVVMEPTVPTAFASLLPAQAPAAAAPPTTTAPPPATTSRPDMSTAAKSLLDRLDKLRQEIQSLEDDLRRLLQAPGATQ